jgi:hypothetical protein
VSVHQAAGSWHETPGRLPALMRAWWEASRAPACGSNDKSGWSEDGAARQVSIPGGRGSQGLLDKGCCDAVLGVVGVWPPDRSMRMYHSCVVPSYGMEARCCFEYG